MKTNQIFFTKIANLYSNKFNYVKLTDDYIKYYEFVEQSFIGKLFL